MNNVRFGSLPQSGTATQRLFLFLKIDVAPLVRLIEGGGDSLRRHAYCSIKALFGRTLARYAPRALAPAVR